MVPVCPVSYRVGLVRLLFAVCQNVFYIGQTHPFFCEINIEGRPDCLRNFASEVEEIDVILLAYTGNPLEAIRDLLAGKAPVSLFLQYPDNYQWYETG